MRKRSYGIAGSTGSRSKRSLRRHIDRRARWLGYCAACPRRVSREISSNGSHDGYRAAFADDRPGPARRPKRSKLATNAWLRPAVASKLRFNWAPTFISALRRMFLVGTFATALSAAFDARAEKRVALVVGNNAYENVPKLEKAVNDAKAVSSSLQAIGFQVQLATDLSRRDFIRQLSAFMDRVGPGDLALLYYAGHGIEVRGVNYILPTDVPPVVPGRESLLTGEAVPTEKIITDLQDRGARAMVFILDACRDNPFKTGTTRTLGGARGLAQGTPPEGVLVLYSAGVGQSALDRMSNNDSDPNSVSRGFSSRNAKERRPACCRRENHAGRGARSFADGQPRTGAGLLRPDHRAIVPCGRERSPCERRAGVACCRQ